MTTTTSTEAGVGVSRRRALVAMTAGFGLLAAACSGAADDDGTGDATGGTFIIGAEAQIETLDPQSTTSVLVHRAMGQIYDTLVVADPAGDNEIHPHIAEDFAVSDDGLTYTFYLRDDVVFHNGEPLTADDVVFTFERWLSADDSPNSWLLEGVESAEEVDERTVNLHLSQPRADILTYLARNDAALLNRTAVEEAGEDYGIAANVVGSGPFEVDSWSPTSDLVLTRYEDYEWGPEVLYENTGPAHLNEVIWRAIPEAQTRLLELQSGSIHAIPPRLPFHEVDNLEDSETVELLRFPLGSTVLLGFHLNSAQQDEKDVRQAMLHGIDRQAIIDDVLYGHARLGDSLVAYGLPGHCECSDIIPGFDPREAERLLDDAGWEPGSDGIRERDGQRLEIVATILDLVPYPDVYTVIQEQLRAVGIDLVVEQAESAQVFAMFAEGTHGVWSVSAPHETPVDAMFNYIHSSNQPNPNRIPYDDTETDAMLEQLRATTDDDEYLELAEQVQRRVLGEYVLVPLWHEEGIVAVSSEVSGYEPYAYANHIFYKLLDTQFEQ